MGGQAWSGLGSAPRWIVLVTTVEALVGLAMVQAMIAARTTFTVSLSADAPGALLLVGMACVQAWLSVCVLRSFRRGDPLRPAWLLIALAGFSRALGGVLAEVVGSYSLWNPLVWADKGSPEQLATIRRLGSLVGGPLEMVLLVAGLWGVLRLMHALGLWNGFKLSDGPVLLIAGALACFHILRAVGSLAGEGAVPDRIAGLAKSILLCVLAVEAAALLRAACRLGTGLIGRCWIAFAAAVFVTLLGETGSWAASQGHPAGGLSLLVHCLWFAAAAAYALGPAYQIAAIERATGKMRVQRKATRPDLGGDRLEQAQAF
jgi:hypothetical protein